MRQRRTEDKASLIDNIITILRCYNAFNDLFGVFESTQYTAKYIYTPGQIYNILQFKVNFILSLSTNCH